MISKSLSNALPPSYSHAFCVSFLVRFLILAVAISLPLISVPNPCAVCCNQHNNQHKNGNPQPLNLPFHPCHRCFMHDIWYAFGCILHFFTGFAVCHIFTLSISEPPSFNRGKGEGRLLPLRCCNHRPLFEFSIFLEENQLPKSILTSIVTMPPATA